ncbi:MAG: hypothetical protein BYD32DRAFT_62942 [Podila humilis]|nr:MAG: hypothetical protein BYD32DRAFT_62942 [Podila humilis]
MAAPRGLASSLRSQTATAAASVLSPGTNNNNTHTNSYYNNNNSNNNSGHHTYRQYGRDATVPDSDDSTEEDEEEYNAYLQEQEVQQKQAGSSSVAQAKSVSIRQLLHDDDPDTDQSMDDDGYQASSSSTTTRQQESSQAEIQARQNQILGSEDEDEDMDEDDEDDDASTSTVSLTEDDIDFNLVYAFHTFVATQEGQASVVRNDSLMLLEDTNVYWWLVRVLKTGVIGYIPAENIETPFERLARLNKYRNVGLSAPTAEFGTFDEPIKSLDLSTLGERSMNRRSVIFTAQNEYFGASENEWDDEDDEEGDEDEMGEYYEGGEDEEEGQASDENRQEEKSALQLEAERVQQEILQDQKQQQKSHYDYDSASGPEDEYDDEPVEEEPVTNRFRRNLLEDDDLVFDAEPRKISLTPSIARDEPSSSGKVNSLRTGTNSRGTDSPQQRQQRPQPSDGYRSPSFDSEEEERQRQQDRERKGAKLNAILDDDKTGRENSSGQPQEAKKATGKVKSLFGFGKSSKDKEKERKEKERLDKERLKSTMASNNGGDNGNNGILPARSNSNGSIGSFSTGQSGQSGAPMSPTSANESSDTLQKEIVALRVYPGNVDFGVSMYKTVVVSQSTLASEVASQAVVKFKLAPEGVTSTNDFFLSVRGVDGDEIVLQPTDKPLAIYQSLTAHLTTPLPPNHRLSISSVSSMMSINSTSSYTSNPPSTPTTPTSPNTVRRVGSGRDPHQRSIRFLLNKKIRRPGSTSSMPSTPTTPTTPIQEDFFWVKVVCMAQDLPQTMLMLDGMGTALDRADPRVQGQTPATKVEHWIPMHATSNAGDVIFKALERIGIRAGVVDGVPEHVLASKRNSVPNGLVIEYQLGLRLNGQTSRRAKQGDELPLAPQVPLSRCYEEHLLAPVRRSPKADVASMPPNPDHVFFLRKSSKSVQAEMNFATREASLNESQRQTPKKVPAPLQAQSLRSGSGFNDSPKSPIQQSPTSASGMASPRSLRSLRSFEDVSDPHHHNGPLSPGFNRTNGTSSPSQSDIRIPRRGDSVAMGPTSPIRTNSHDNLSGRPSPTMQNHPHMGPGSRTPTPDHHNNPGMGPHMGRNRSPSVSQGLRPGQAPSPSPSSHTDQDGSRPSTPERPARPERPERPERQRAISPPMTHGPSPLSLSAVMLQGEIDGSQAQGRHLHPHQQQSLSVGDIQVNGRPLSGSSATSDSSSKIAPLNIKKNATQGLDIVLSKGVIRSSRLMPSKQYRYSFIPSEGGEEVDISEIIEDILGEDDGRDNDDQEHSQENALRQLNGGNDAPRRINPGAVATRSMSNSSRSSRNGAQSDRDRLEFLGTSARGGDTLMKLEKVLAMDLEGENTANARNQNTGAGYGNRSNPRDLSSPVPSAQPARTLASPLSLRSSSPAHNHKRDSDVEIQVASVASLSTRSASPVVSEQHSTRAFGQDGIPGSPRTMRSASPLGAMAKSTLLSNSINSPSARARSPSVSQMRSASPSSSPSPSSAAGMTQENNGARSFSPIPRRLQSPSPAPRQQSSMGNDFSKVNGVSSPAPSARSNSGSSITSITQRSRSASTSATETNTRYANKGYMSPNAGKDQWLLSSDYNAGMQDLLTLVRAGRSSSVSSSSPMRGGGPLIGKDGKIVPLPSTIKASLISGNSRDLLGAKSTPSSDTPNHGNNNNNNNNSHHDTTNTTNHDINDKKQLQHDDYPRAKSPAELEQVRRMMVMLNELTLKDVQEECHPDVYECWKDVDADLDRVERELDDLLVTVKASIL